MSDLKTAAQQALEALENTAPLRLNMESDKKFYAAIIALRAALAQDQAEPTSKEGLQVESAATTQQPVGDTPPSDYRRGYWAGFAIGKREGRIEAEDAALKAQEQAEPVQEPVAWLYEAGTGRTLHWRKPPLYGTPLYIAPPKAEPVQEPQTLDDAMQQPRAMAQAYESGYKAGVAHEREACAQVCEARFVGDLTREDMEARRCAAAIRARGVQL